MANLYLPGDDILGLSLAQFCGYFWCRYAAGQVVGDRIVRFLASPEEFEEERVKFGIDSIITASGDEAIEQLAFKALPPYHLNRDEMAKVEARIYQMGWWEIYLHQLRSVLRFAGPLTPQQQWGMVTADARSRAKAAFLVIDAQRPKQQALL